MQRVLITGGAGFLGAALQRHAPPGWEVHVTQRRAAAAGRAHAVELSDAGAVAALWARVRPDLVVHTAYSIADGERDIWRATRNVVDATLAAGVELIHLSTDLVLDGERAPYAESAPAAPVNEYGRWKARAEELVLARAPRADVVRTSLLTSFAPLDPRSAWVAAGLRGEARVTLFADELRCPIAVSDLALQIWEIAALPAAARGGVWHLAGPEALSRYAIGLLIAAHLGLSPSPLVAGSVRDAPEPRPRDLRLLTARADRALRTRARPVSALAAATPLAPDVRAE